MARITKRVVDAAQPAARPFFIWDDALKGFGLLVFPSGVKSFVFQYRTKEGRTRRATIAKVGTLTPDKARELAEAMAWDVRQGNDPLAEKRKHKDALTVAALLDLYMASPRYAEKAATTQAIGRGQIERHLKPLLGKRYAKDLTPDDVRRAYAAIRDGKTAARIKTRQRGLARVKGGAGAARYAMRLFRAAMNWAVAEGHLPANPCTGVAFGADGKREAILSEDEYRRLFAALEKMERERRLRPAQADAVRLIALTGARRGEIAGLKWREVENGRLVLPPTRHKTGAKTGKPRIIALPTAGQEIIARQPAGGPDDFVFAPAKGSGPLELSKIWRVIRKEADLPETYGLHALRHSLASHLAIGGAEIAQIMAALGHRQLSTAARYIHFADRARSALAERAAAPALAGMAAAKGTPKADIVRLEDAR